jgi:glyoxylase-like metal-dependent hydrolase (beta-lactamase superfamily II)
MVSTLDLEFLGRPGVVAVGLIEGPDGLALVDPGPASTIERLRLALAAQGRALKDVGTILLTHIHLDHSGGVGVLVRENPRLQVYVHERGAPHVIDPAKLIGSASRLYGESMDRLWGEIAPVPADRVQALGGGEVLSVAGLDVRVAYTPGHASHHVSYFEGDSGTAFVGDTGGLRVGETLLVVPPTPPPEVDIEAWDASLEAIRAWEPRRVFVTHFGAFDDPVAHLADLQERLHEHAALARELLVDASLDDGQREAAFVARVTATFVERLPNADSLRRYTTAIPIDHCWQGLLRYWRKRL